MTTKGLQISVTPDQTPEFQYLQSIVTHLQEASLQTDHSHSITHRGRFLIQREYMQVIRDPQIGDKVHTHPSESRY